MNRSPIDLSMAAVQLVQRKPRSAPELARLLGVTETHAMNYLKAMEAEGLVDRAKPPRGELRGALPWVFTWVPYTVEIAEEA